MPLTESFSAVGGKRGTTRRRGLVGFREQPVGRNAGSVERPVHGYGFRHHDRPRTGHGGVAGLGRRVAGDRVAAAGQPQITSTPRREFRSHSKGDPSANRRPQTAPPVFLWHVARGAPIRAGAASRLLPRCPQTRTRPGRFISARLPGHCRRRLRPSMIHPPPMTIARTAAGSHVNTALGFGATPGAGGFRPGGGGNVTLRD